jgi:uncharacterized membrane protein YeaQ/YmgE (transglycosylase-associated protein family)
MGRAAMPVVLRLGFFALIVGLAAGALALWIGFEHNNQGEFVDNVTGAVNLEYCLLIFGSWFAVVGTGTFVVAAAIRRLASDGVGDRHGGARDR